uniref:4HBT domain-containing protein n=1 Tax=Panagrellus redivivus TaxID=6233 RepID=A0A7E4UX59_PANRE
MSKSKYFNTIQTLYKSYAKGNNFTSLTASGRTIMTKSTPSDGKDLTEAFRKYVSGPDSWQKTFMKYPSRCKVIEFAPGRAVYEFLVTEDTVNSVGTMHGGCTATLLDVCMANVLVDEKALSDVNSTQLGTTVDLTISYLNGAQLGDTVVIEAQSVKRGRALAFLTAEAYSKKTKKPIALAKQTLALLPKPKL